MNTNYVGEGKNSDPLVKVLNVIIHTPILYLYYIPVYTTMANDWNHKKAFSGSAVANIHIAISLSFIILSS